MCEVDGHALSHMTDRYRYAGQLCGTSNTTATICYLGKTGAFTGYELFTGALAGHAGTFAIRAHGGFSPEEVHADLEIVPGSGTGQLRGLRGSGRMRFPMGAEHGTLELDWTLTP